MAQLQGALDWELGQNSQWPCPPCNDETLDVPLDMQEPSYKSETLEEDSRAILLLFEFLC